MSFSGIILSDSMNMGAIKKFYDPAESTLLALKAGVDIVMLSEEHYDHSPDYLTNQIASLETVKNAIIDGRLAIEEVDEKLFRILSVKLNKMKIRTPALNISEIDEIKKFENRIAQKGLTLINRGLWPLPESGPIACVNCSPRSAYTRLMNSRGIGPNQKKPAFDYLREVLEKSNDNFIFISCEEADNGSLELFSRAAAIVAVTEDYPLPGEDFPKEAQEKLVIDLSEKYGDKMIILGLRSSYELSKYPEEVTYLCSFSSRACAARGAGKVLLDRIENPEGTAPVTARTGT